MARRWAGPTRAEYEEVLSSEQIVDMARLRGYARHGVASAVRGDVWMHLLGVLAADTAGEASAVRAMLIAWADTPVAHPAQSSIQPCAEECFLNLYRIPRTLATQPQAAEKRAKMVRRLTAVVGAFLNTHTPLDDLSPIRTHESDPPLAPPSLAVPPHHCRSLTTPEPDWPGSPPQADDMDLDWAIPRTSHPENVALSPTERRESVHRTLPSGWDANHWHPALVYLCAPLVASIEADAGTYFSFEALMARLERR